MTGYLGNYCRWLVMLAAGCGAFAAAAVAAPRADLQDIRTRINKLQQEIESTELSKTEASDALKASEQAISQLNRKLHELSTQQQQAGVTLAELQQRAVITRNRIAAHQDLLGQLLYRQYLQGMPDPLQSLLNQQDSNQAARQLHYYSYIAKARADVVLQHRQELQRLQEVERQTSAKRDELGRIKAEQDRHKRQLEREQNARRGVLTRLSRQISQQRRTVASLQRDEKRLTRLVERLGRIVSSKPHVAPRGGEKIPQAALTNAVFGRLKGKLSLPVQGELLHRYGSPREDTGMVWKGIFLRTGAGQEIKAVAAGRVVFADWLRGFGNLIILDHDDGFMTLYGNNETLYKGVGDRINASDTIATAGNSGGNAQSGLYFELRFQGKPFDPMAWVKLK